jgi:hypothetical protein
MLHARHQIGGTKEWLFTSSGTSCGSQLIEWPFPAIAVKLIRTSICSEVRIRVGRLEAFSKWFGFSFEMLRAVRNVKSIPSLSAFRSCFTPARNSEIQAGRFRADLRQRLHRHDSSNYLGAKSQIHNGEARGATLMGHIRYQDGPAAALRLKLTICDTCPGVTQASWSYVACTWNH